MRPQALDFREVIARQAAVPLWRLENGPMLVRHWQFPDFAHALALANQVGAIAEAMNHHPDLTVGWGKLTVAITTHDAGGLTELDFAFAARVDALV